MASLLKKIVSGLDFWDKAENATQRQQAIWEEEERKKRQAEADAAAAARRASLPPRTNMPPARPDPAGAMPLEKVKPTPAPKPTDNRNANQKRLDELTQANMEAAKKQATQGQNWVEKTLLNRGSNQRNAEITARGRATRDFQEAEGYNRNPDVLAYNRRTSEKAKENTTTGASSLVAPILSAGRVGTGIVQGAAGLYDIVTPGKGQNRLTQSSTKKAIEMDELSKQMDIENAYKVGNVAGEILSYFSPTVLTKAGKVGGAVAGVGTKAGKLLTKAPKMGGKVGRFGKEAVEELFDPTNLEQELNLTGRYLGQDSAQGEPITGPLIAENAAQSVFGAFLPPGLRRAVQKLGGSKAEEDAAIAAAGGTASKALENTRTNNAAKAVDGGEIPTSPTGDPPPLQPGEVSEGVTSVNPTQEIDAAAAEAEAAAKAAQQAEVDAAQAAQQAEANQPKQKAIRTTAATETASDVAAGNRPEGTAAIDVGSLQNTPEAILADAAAKKAALIKEYPGMAPQDLQPMLDGIDDNAEFRISQLDPAAQADVPAITTPEEALPVVQAPIPEGAVASEADLIDASTPTAADEIGGPEYSEDVPIPEAPLVPRERSPIEDLMDQADLEDPQTKLARQQLQRVKAEAQLEEMQRLGIAHNSKAYRDARRHRDYSRDLVERTIDEIAAEKELTEVMGQPGGESRGSQSNPFKDRRETEAYTRMERRQKLQAEAADRAEKAKAPAKPAKTENPYKKDADLVRDIKKPSTGPWAKMTDEKYLERMHKKMGREGMKLLGIHDGKAYYSINPTKLREMDAERGPNPRAPKDLEFDDTGNLTSVNGKPVKAKPSKTAPLEKTPKAAKTIEPGKVTVKKDPDFDFNGNHIVSKDGQSMNIYFDRDSNSWRRVTDPSEKLDPYGSEDFMGWNKTEATAKASDMLDEKAADMPVPKSAPKPKAAPAVKKPLEKAPAKEPALKADSLYKDAAGFTHKSSTGEVLTKAEAKAEGITQPKLSALEKAAAAPTVAERVEIPNLKSSKTMQFAKPSVKGSSTAVYTTGDTNLTNIMRSSIIADKGTANSAFEHEEALKAAGFTRNDIKAIRNFAVKNSDEDGNVDTDALAGFIDSRLNKAAPAPKAAPTPPPKAPPKEQPIKKASKKEAPPPPKQERPKVEPPEGSKPLTGRVAENAPEVRKGMIKELGSVAKELENNPQTHSVFSNEELNAVSDRVVKSYSDEELLNMYANGFTPKGLADIAQANAANKRLAAMADAGDERAMTSIDNIIDETTKFESESGRGLNYAQGLFEGMPAQAQASYLIRAADKLRAKGKESKFPLIKQDPKLKLEIQSRMTEYIKKTEGIKETLATQEAKVQAIMDRVQETKTATKADVAEAIRLVDETDKARLEIQKSNGDLVKYYDTLIPAASISSKSGDWARTMMLSSPIGRVNDVATTGFSAVNTLLKMTGEAGLGKAANLVGGRGKFVDTLPSVGAFGRGTRSGARKSAAELGGNVLAGDLQKSIRNKAGGGKAQLLRAAGNSPAAKLKRFVRAGSELATDYTQGIKSVEINRLARQEAKQMGLKGDAAKAWTAARESLPNSVMEQKGNLIHETVNNLNDNPLTNLLDGISNQVVKFPYLGEQLKNITMPFTKWAGGNAWNNVTDRNAVAQFGKFLNAARKRDGQGMIRHAAGVGVDLASAATLGYKLAEAGVLTDEDAEGYKDGGVYIHIGDRYIPATFLGFFAPSMMMGKATYDAMQRPDKSTINDLVTAGGDTLVRMWNAYSRNTIPGQNNQSLRAAEQKGFSTDTAAVVAGAAAGTYVPSAFSDVNAGLNSSTTFNPTGEAAETKATKINPETGNEVKDYPKTAWNQFQNRLPYFSQKLKRKEGVAADDLVDRITHGNRDTATSKEKRTQEQNVEARKAENEKNNVPDFEEEGFEEAVKARQEAGDYDSAITALQQKYDHIKDDENIAASTKKDLQDDIKILGIEKKNGYKPETREKYKSIGVQDWRNLGNPDHDDYNQKLYDELWRYDQLLSFEKVAGGDFGEQKYSPSKSGRGGGGGGSGSGFKGPGSAIQLQKIDLGDLKLKGLSTPPIPRIAKIRANQLIKKRTISVRKGR